MRNMEIHVGKDGPKISVRETEDQGAWELEWTGNMEQRHARRMLKAAEIVVLQSGGERIVLTCGADHQAVRAELDRWPASMVSNAGDRRRLDLMAPAADGFVHEDDDLRTPLRKITCPACVRRTARNQTRKPSARGTGQGR